MFNGKINELKEFPFCLHSSLLSVFRLLVVVAVEEKKFGDGSGGGCNGGDRL